MQALGLVWGHLDPFATGLSETRTPIETPNHFGARLLLDHWRARNAEGGFVLGRDLPSRALACVLRNLAIYEPLDGGTDFRVRLAGTAFIRRFGRDVTGLTLSQIYDRWTFEKRRADLDALMVSSTPCVADVQLARETRVFLHFEALRLAVRAPRRDAVWALAGIFYSDWA